MSIRVRVEHRNQDPVQSFVSSNFPMPEDHVLRPFFAYGATDRVTIYYKDGSWTTFGPAVDSSQPEE